MVRIASVGSVSGQMIGVSVEPALISASRTGRCAV
jgi:hypothetical protein